jgi:hypothetical protein
MDEIESRVRCLELAAQLNRASGDHCAEGVVKTATLLYKFLIATPPEETPVSEPADKPRRGRPPKPAGMFD